MLGRPGKANDKLPAGFELGLRGMCVGESRRVFLPPSLAYPADRKVEIAAGKTGVIKRNQPLLLEATLLSINGRVR